MGTSTVSGPFRSENGFQELDSNGEWVPVAGGGGGGVTSIIAGSGISVSSPTGAVTISATGGGGGGGGEVCVELATGSFSSTPNNRYSNDFTLDPPSGSSAGTIIQLPLIEVGQSYSLFAFHGSPISAWAIQLPSIAGTAISSFYNALSGFSAPAGTFGALLPYFAVTTFSGPNDLLYLYGVLFTPLRITRIPDLTLPGFGTIAFFQISNTPTFVVNGEGFGDPTQYPFVNVAAP